MRILIADDDPFSRRILVKMLSQSGEVNAVADGIEALIRFREARAEGRPFDLICLDIDMPKLDGQRTVEMIRELEASRGGRAVVFMTSAHSTAENVKNAKVKGQCDAFLVKPVDPQRLREAMEQAGLTRGADSGQGE